MSRPNQIYFPENDLSYEDFLADVGSRMDAMNWKERIVELVIVKQTIDELHTTGLWAHRLPSPLPRRMWPWPVSAIPAGGHRVVSLRSGA